MKYGVQRIDDMNQSICTMNVETRQEKVTFYNAVQNPSHKLSEFVNKEIRIKDVYMEKAEYNSDEGKTEGVKTIIITPEGESILANSEGIANSLYSIFDIFGMPSEWGDEPLTVVVRQVEVAKGIYYKLEVK